MNITRKIKAVICAAAVALLAVFVILCGTVSAKNRKIKEYRKTVAEQEQTITEQKELIARLANMEAVHCEVSITVRNTAVMGSNKSGEISQDAKQVALYLRGEILEALEASRNEKETNNMKNK